MITGNVSRSTSTAVYTFTGGTIVYYAFCREMLVREKFKMQQVKHNLADYVAQRGKEEDEDDSL